MEKPEQLLIAIILIILLLKAVQKIDMESPKEPVTSYTTRMKGPAEYTNYIRAKLTEKDVAPGMTPVIIWSTKDKLDWGQGVITQVDGGDTLMSVSHVFGSDPRIGMNFYIQRLRPWSQQLEPIAAVERVEGSDIIEGVLGASTIIRGNPKTMLKEGLQGQALEGGFVSLRAAEKTGALPKNFPRKATSLVTGKESRVVGIFFTKQNATYALIEGSTIVGESGGGYWGGGAHIFLAETSLPTDADMREKLEVGEEVTSIIIAEYATVGDRPRRK